MTASRSCRSSRLVLCRRLSPRRRTTSELRTGRTRIGCRAPTTSPGPASGSKPCARVLDPLGSLFLNVGSKPTDPWTALDVAQAARPHLQLQNTLHWVKSIAIDRDAAGGARAGPRPGGRATTSRSTARGSSTTATSSSSTSRRRAGRRSTGWRVGVPYQDESNITRWRGAGGGRRCRGNTWFLPVRHHPEPRRGPAAPGDLSGPAARVLPAPARADADRRGRRPVPGPRQHGRGLRPARRELRGNRDGRGLPATRHRADATALSSVSDAAHAPHARRDVTSRRSLLLGRSSASGGGLQRIRLPRPDVHAFARFALTSILRVRFIGSGLLE